jgi:hypothetical protein
VFFVFHAIAVFIQAKVLYRVKSALSSFSIWAVEAQLASKKTKDKYPLHSLRFFFIHPPFLQVSNYFSSINGKNDAAITKEL